MKAFRYAKALFSSANSFLSTNSARCRLHTRSLFTSTLTDQRYAKNTNNPEQRNSTNIIRSPIRDYDIPEKPFLPHYLMENWHRFPNKTALINGETGAKMSYSELQSRIVKVGGALKRLGFGKGDVMILVSPNCPEFCVIYTAATAIGITVSAINPQYTQGELEHAVNYSEAKILAFSPFLKDAVSASLPNCHTLKKTIALGAVPNHQTLDDLLQDDGQAFPENIEYKSKGDMIILPYSSGTSGPPKGVMLTSYCTVANIIQMRHPLVGQYDLSSVMECIYGAAPTSSSVIEQFQERFGEKIDLCQGFGMTELSPASLLNPKKRRKPETVGVVIPNTQFKIRDLDTDELLPAYKEGELCVKGPQVLKGYYKNDKATRDTIIDGLLHTGDVAYYDEDGYTVITDRIKDLIKVKGFQVAPAELEDVLLTHPAIEDVAVIGKPDELAGELPKAFVVLKPGQKVTEEDIANYVKAKLAPYKQLKGGVEFRKEIPKSASGKILKRILRDELHQSS